VLRSRKPGLGNTPEGETVWCGVARRKGKTRR
jgi:hypothetical protein